MMIVTGYVNLEEREGHRRTRRSEEYLERARWLLDSTAPVLLFCDSDVGRYGTVRQEPAEFDPPWHESNALAGRVTSQTITWDPGKDTLLYFCLMRQKIRWLERATKLVGASHYSWIDFGYRHLPGDDACDLYRRAPSAGKIRIAEISYVPLSARRSREEFYRLQRYAIGGGILTSAAPEIEWLAARIDEEWRWALERGYAVTDEMMLGWIRYQHPERFDLYYADHPTLLTNYLRPRGSFDLIRAFAEQARLDGNYAECDARLAELGHAAGFSFPIPSIETTRDTGTETHRASPSSKP